MTTNITHASWVNPIDQGYWDSWNPQWSKAVMDHLGVESEEQVAAIMYTEQHPDQIDSMDYMVSFKDRTVVPYEGFSIGTIRFGEVFINGQRVPCCTDIHGGGHPELLYIDMDLARSLSPIKDDPETGLPANYPGPGAEGNCVPHMTKMLTIDLPLCGSITQYTCHSPFGGEQVVTILTLPNLECGMVIDKSTIQVRTQVKATPQPVTPPYPGWRDPGGDPTRLHCDSCGVAHYPADLTDVYTGEGDDPPQALCPACLPAGAPTPESPTDDELPVGNVTPEDLHTELFPGDEI